MVKINSADDFMVLGFFFEIVNTYTWLNALYFQDQNYVGKRIHRDNEGIIMTRFFSLKKSSVLIQDFGKNDYARSCAYCKNNVVIDTD